MDGKYKWKAQYSMNHAKTWCLSTVNFVRRDSERPCEKGATSFVGVGDSCDKRRSYLEG